MSQYLPKEGWRCPGIFLLFTCDRNLFFEMKTYLVLAMAALMSTVTSCRKNEGYPDGKNRSGSTVRKVHYELYTDENFSDNQENIQFTLFMRDAGKTIFDSSLATMKIKDIPDFDHRLVIEKIVPGNNTSTLTVGFVYQIENVGLSSWLAPFPASDTIGLIKFSFR
jgi:hypothetical protein